MENKLKLSLPIHEIQELTVVRPPPRPFILLLIKKKALQIKLIKIHLNLDFNSSTRPSLPQKTRRATSILFY